MTSRNLRSATRFLFASSAAVLSIALPAQAAPSWSDITPQSGSTFGVATNGVNTTTITQTGLRAVGYANNLSIRAGDTVNIEQAAGNGSLFVAKANARDGLPSAILGKLNANGNVMILDGNGVLFGKDAKINVGGIIASTGDVNNADIMNTSKTKFDITGSGSLVNFGVINNATINAADAGLVAFVAPTVVNDGVINAKLGRVALASGDRVTVDLNPGNPLVEVALNARQSAALLENDGVINAHGGTVQLTADTARGIVNNVINMDGVIDVTSVSQKNGKIILGGGNANVNVKGKLTADGGGSVDVQANNVTVDKNAVISATGAGGSIRFMALSNGYTSIRLPFIGTVPIVNGRGSYNGTMTAGNKVETSATTSLLINKDLKVTAADWLLDPINITIDSDMATAIMTALNANTNTTVLTSAPGLGAGDIILNNGVNITWSSSANFNLVADNNVLLNGKIISNFAGTGEQGAVNITSNGTFTIAGTGLIETKGGNIVIDNKGVYTATANSVRAAGAATVDINQVNGGLLQNVIDSILNVGTGLNTVHAFEGTYAENVNIDMNNFLLSGANVGINPNTGVRGSEAVIVAANAALPAVRSTNNNVAIDGMKISGGKDGVNFTGDNSRVVNSIIENQTGKGVSFTGVDNGVIAGNLFKGQGGNAAEVRQANKLTFTDNVIESGAAAGLVASQVSTVDVLRNKVNTVVADGLSVFRFVNATFGNNDVENAGGIAIRAQSGTGTLDIINNEVINSGYDGILVNVAKNVNVTGNIIKDAGTGIDDGGIVLRGVESAVIDDNNIDRTGWYGISADGVNKAVITNNIINATGATGIFNRNSKFADAVEPSVLIKKNKITNTGGTGISLTKFLTAHVIDNNVDTTGTFGIWATGDFLSASPDNSRVLISDNIVKNNQQNAIRANNVQDITITQNEVDTTRYAGIRVHDFNTATITKNNVTNAGLSGVDIRNGKTSLLFKDNTVSSAARDGVYILNVKNIDIINNNVIDSRDDGIAIGGSDNANITNNRVRNSKVNGLYVFGPNNGFISVTENIFTDNDIGAHFESGLIDLTGLGNQFIGGRVGLRFAPAGSDPSLLQLVDNDGPGVSPPSQTIPTNFGGTIGEQLFDGQTLYFVELANGAFFNPGSPTWLNALNSTYRMGDGTLFRPSTTGGILSPDQLGFLESRFFHFADDASLGRFFFGFVPEIDQEDIFNQFGPAAFGAGNVRVTILGLPRTGAAGVGADIAGFLNNLAPFAGGEGNDIPQDVSSLTPDMLNQIEAAAGGNATGPDGSPAGGGASNSACWTDAAVGAQQGQVTTYSFGSQLGMSDIEQENNCANQ